MHAMIKAKSLESRTVASRLMSAGKALFARLGYDLAATAAIAREAGTSESQLVRYFGGKAGLLEAICNEDWQALNIRLRNGAVESPHAQGALLNLAMMTGAAFADDPDFGYLAIFEEHRLRAGDAALLNSQGYLDFNAMVMRLIRRGQRDGSFAAGLNEAFLEAAIIGALESMLRGRLTAQRAGKPPPGSDEDFRLTFAALLAGFAEQK